LQDIDTLVNSKDFESAIDLIREKLSWCNCQRDNLKLNLQLGSVFIKAKQPLLAISIFEMLDHTIDDFTFCKWEPELSVEIWTSLLQAYQQLRMIKPHDNQSDIQDKQNNVIQKICKVDPGKALMLNRKV
jgi:hypothetical protein